MTIKDGNKPMMIWGGPAKNKLHLIIAQDTANNSSAYLDSGSDKNRDPACTRTHASLDFCWRTKPRPRQLAFVQIRVGLLGSKKDRVGADIKDNLAFSKASSRPSDQTNSFLVLRRERRGLNRLAIVGVLAES